MEDSRKKYYEERNRKRRRRIQRMKLCIMAMAIAVILLLIYLIWTLGVLIFKSIEYSKANTENERIQEVENGWEYEEDGEDVDVAAQAGTRAWVLQKVNAFAKAHDFSLEEYPEEMLELLEKNSETEEFVLYYPLRKGTCSRENLNEYLRLEQVPLFFQWDERWGYYSYGNGQMGLKGCGPTCLSMVALHLLQNPHMTPIYMADFAMEHGFYESGVGTSWDLMSVGARELGLSAKEVPLVENVVLRYLTEGKPIICAMGPGEFTETGHFIVLVGTEQGKLVINDPNSKVRSAKLWSFEEIKYQIKNMWVYSVR